ncbi:hypothetical protein MIND_00474600 [Mycena indigotica]|uniref:Mitochondrial cytochrome c oxidase subunit VIa n=1 Tax=Mycena indigotica TaxID=2126181 RepID=A0A8H6W6N3_9AGAR|nr:uncharacterized protein MIND_00474600 [Mycena indigotica]KAF7306827.1 hypothetical protein MIND_00474600 [Mycena indigotica]
MLHLARRAIRPGGLRAYSELVVGKPPSPQWVAEQKAIEHHALQTTDFWRKMSYYVCVPALAIFGLYVYNVEIEHKAHNAHLIAENDGKLPQPPRFEYLNRRNKPFPWGPNSLFYNSVNQRDMSIDD